MTPRHEMVSLVQGFCRSLDKLALLALLVLTGLAGPGCHGKSTSTSEPDPAAALMRSFPAHATRVLRGSESFAATATGFALPIQGDPATAVAKRGGLSAALPKRGDEAIRFHTLGGFEFRVREGGAEGAGRLAEGAVAYDRRGGTSFWSATEEGYEEWLMLGPGVATGRAPVATWDIEGATVREGAGAVEVLGSDGGVKVRVRAPIAFAASGRLVPIRLGVSGSKIELWADAGGEAALIDPVWSQTTSMASARYWPTATVLGSGAVLVAGGHDGLVAVGTAELYDPTTAVWSSTGALQAARYFHRAVLLQDGKVLVTGGIGGSGGTMASAELYDPTYGTWSAAHAMLSDRDLHTAVLLADGKVLVAGGYGSGGYLSSAEIYNPSADSWTATTNTMSDPRVGHTATLLTTGALAGKVLVAGGANGSPPLSTADLYDPNADTWAAAQPMPAARGYHAAALLSDGNVLVSGGTNGSTTQSTAYLFSTSGVWSTTGSMPSAHQNHALTLLSSGKVLASGGMLGGAYLATTAIYDPGAGTWTSSGSLTTARAYHAAVPVAGGRVLVAGGYDGSSSFSTAELFELSQDAWSTGASLGVARSGHTDTLLPNGQVLVTGGNGTSTLSSTRLYDGNSWTAGDAMSVARERHRTTLLADGKVLVTGGHDGTSYLSSVDLYDGGALASSAPASMSTVRADHTATLLADGTVLVAGGRNNTGHLSSAQRYDVLTGWTTTFSMSSGRSLHTATRLANGKVLVAGGLVGSQPTAGAQIFNPSDNRWTTTTSPMSVARRDHRAVLLPDGKVLVVGGFGFSSVVLNSAEIYDPGSNSWSSAGTMSTPRSDHTITLLMENGVGRDVLVTGGHDGSVYLSSAEVYDPIANVWALAAPMLTARGKHSATQLPSGTILVAGGSEATGKLSSSQIYTPAKIDDNNTCTTDDWDTTAGHVTHAAVANGTACDDGNACTQTDTCQAGACTGANPVVCTALDQCHDAGTCDTATGLCSNPDRANGATCNDGDACTQTDTCQAGACTGANPVVCTALDQCHDAGMCNAATGLCSNPNKTDGTTCSDDDACTQTDTCQAGTCTGANPVICTALDQCHKVGTCDAATGVCSDPSKDDDTTCDDGNACTLNDACQAGVCTGAHPVACTALDQCHDAGTCDTATGLCSNPNKTDGTTCNDGDACTQTDTCQAGACTGAGPVVCMAMDQCHDAGTCDTATGLCSNPNKTDGTTCNDGDACTQTDTCQAGMCSGGNPVVCVALDQCHLAGTCDTVTGLCSNQSKVDGTACDDGNPCTQQDACQSGICVASNAPANAPCPDGDLCNGNETCDGAGTCIAGTRTILDDGDPCTVDSCDPATNVVSHTYAQAGSACSNGDWCLGVGTCDAQHVCILGTQPTIEDANPKTLDTCDPLTGVIDHVLCPELSTQAATTMDRAASSHCIGTAPLQTGLTATLDPARVAVIRGRVSDDDGWLVGATISVAGHPEYGETLSQTTGWYDLTVHGGGSLTLVIERVHYLTVRRQVDVPVQDYVLVPEATMTKPDQPSAVDLDLGSLARGSVVGTGAQARQATLIFQPATTAMAGGTMLPDAINVRATEYTVAFNELRRMPADLPPTSGYTYAVSYQIDGVDEGTQVTFDKPVFAYVENFTQMPVGGIVPAAYFDKDANAWMPSTDGKVIRIVGRTNGLADVDTDGDGLADTLLVMDTYEREQLATAYADDTTLWRVPITHFSDWDFNWPLTWPADAISPLDALKDLLGNDNAAGACKVSGSIIECENQTLGQAIPVAGTPFSLTYWSNRTPGRRAAYELKVKALPDVLTTGSIQRVDVRVVIAGQEIREWLLCTDDPSNECVPGATVTLSWDGRGAYGRLIQGRQPVTVWVGYTYNAVYGTPVPNGFGLPGSGVTVTGSLAQQEITLWAAWNTALGTWLAAEEKLGGFGFDVQHRYDPVGKIIHFGYGGELPAKALGQIISLYAGGGTDAQGENIPVTDADINIAGSVAVAPDGTVYFAETGKHRIRKVTPNGAISTVAGTGTAGYSDGNGNPLAAQLWAPRGIALGPDGSLYVADSENNRIRKLDAQSGQFTTVAGDGSQSITCGDGLPATSASLWEPWAVTVATDGTLFIADSVHDRVRRVGPDQTITTFAGQDVCSGGAAISCPQPSNPVGDGDPAACAHLNRPQGVALGRDGSVYISEYAGNRIRKVSANGVIETIAGDGTSGFAGDGGASTSARLSSPVGLAVGADGSVLVADSENHRVRRVTPERTIHTVAGSFLPGSNSGDGGPATAAGLNLPRGVAIAPNGTLYVGTADRIRRVSTALPGYAGAGDIVIASRDGSLVYTFDPDGRHRKTQDALTGAILLTFGYDANGYLNKIADVAGNETTIQRDATTGAPTGITGPYNHVTPIQTYGQTEGKGYLYKVTNPNGEVVEFDYWSGGLMKTLIDPKGQQHDFTFDSLGRLSLDTNPAGGWKSLQRSESGRSYSVDVTTGLSTITAPQTVTTTHTVDVLDNGAELRTVLGPDDIETVTLLSSDGSRSIAHADGTTISASVDGDPRFGLQAPVVKQLVLSSGSKTMTVNMTRTTTPSAPSSPFAFTQLVETAQVVAGGQTATPFTRTYDATTRKITEVSSVGRTRTTWLDAQGRVSEAQVSGLPKIVLTYDNKGRVWKVTQKHPTVSSLDRVYEIAYRADGEIDWIKDPDTVHLAQFDYDLVGRPTTVTEPGVGGSLVTAFTYDDNGNLSTLTPPGKTAHAFGVRGDDVATTYIPPDLNFVRNSTDFTSLLDGRPDTATIPNGTAAGANVSVQYDSAGRLSHVSTTGGAAPHDLTFHYALSTDLAEPGKLTSIDGPVTGSAMTFTSDGILPVQTAAVDAFLNFIVTIDRTFDHRFRLSTEQVNGGSSVSFGYDDDDLLLTAGALIINRNGANALLHDTELTVGGHSVTEDYTYKTTGFSEPGSYVAKRDGALLFSIGYTTHDTRGRLVEKTENIGGVPHTYEYGYDAADRLATYKKDSSLIASYTYDANGNRTGIGWSTDEQDRLSTSPWASYTYTDDGARSTRTAGGQTTTYIYDLAGNLRSVARPSPQPLIAYGVDAFGRRVSKVVGGTVDRAFAWDGARIVAEFDATGAIVSRFVYGTSGHVPDYMTKGTSTYRILKDHLGSVRLVVNVATGAVAQQIDYDPWGKVLSDSGEGFQPFGFAGGLYDPDTGLVRFGARDYDAETGVWTAKDPGGFSGGQNLYGYAFGDPVNYVDVNGRLPVAVLAWALPAAAGALSGAEMELASQITDRVLNFDICTPVSWGGVLTAGLVGGAFARVLAPKGDNVVTLWKAPQAGRSGGAEEVVHGYSPTQYPGMGPFFSTERSVAESYRYHYQNGLQEIKIPKHVYDGLVRDGIVRVDGLEHASIHVPAEGLGIFNAALRLGPPNAYYP